jgi:hypothetical protein
MAVLFCSATGQGCAEIWQENSHSHSPAEFHKERYPQVKAWTDTEGKAPGIFNRVTKTDVNLKFGDHINFQFFSFKF